MPTRKLDPNKKQKVKEALAAGASAREAAQAAGVSTGTVANVRALDADAQLAQAKEQRRIVEGQYREALAKIGKLQGELAAVQAMTGMVDQICPMAMSIKTAHKRHQAVPFLVASDWHSDEVVDAAAVSNLNEYSPTVAKDRAKTLFEAAADILRIYAGNSDIDTMVIAALGDFCSMYLHDELVQTNAVTPPEALLAVLDMLTGGIDYILAAGAIQNILLVGAVGNHGRLTKKPQAKRRSEINFEWILYSLLARHYAAKGETRVHVQIPAGYFSWLEVLGRAVRLHHGDAIRYQGGVGGIHIPLNKAISAWNKARHADLDIMGHWHTTLWSRDYVTNGSLIGYSEYSQIIKADPEPPQQSMFLLHNRYGPTGFYPLRVQ